MGQNLRARLRRIRDAKKREEASPPAEVPAEAGLSGPVSAGGLPPGFGPEWVPAGFKVLRRSVAVDLPFVLPAAFSRSLAILVPDFFRYGSVPAPGDLFFFDLETTGLSGGAGTVAFLAAFGRFAALPGNTAFPAASALVIEQFLLLDYSGEADFLNALLPCLTGNEAGKIAVSFNGKSFDSQILKTRFLMNAFSPPFYYHADLLHPARRLWKRLLPDCSQKTLEEKVLGLDRTGDIGGEEAPDIWFDFLKTGETKDLFGICDHNVRDLRGLASLLLVLEQIAGNPTEAHNKFLFDFEALSLWWRKILIAKSCFFTDEEHKAGRELLETAVARGLPRALYTLGLDYFGQGRREEALSLLASLTQKACPGDLKALALRRLAIDAEWRRRDPAAALSSTEAALALPGIREGLKSDLLLRRERLHNKLTGSTSTSI
jgi:uncharacterized protein YprB with RNaseH-like and TPR domain